VVILLVIGLIFATFAPIFAAGIALLLGIAFIFGMSSKRTSQVGDEHGAAAQERREAGQTQRSSASARPAAGEGQAAAGHRAARTRA
jgi:hypothetical protein